MKWISVDNQLPGDFNHENIGENYVIVFDGKKKMKGVGFYDFDDKCWYYNLNGYNEMSGNDITHFQFFPEDPL